LVVAAIVVDGERGLGELQFLVVRDCEPVG